MRRLLPIAILALLTVAGPAQAAPAKRLWATVNVCDHSGARNVIGIRGSMPGNGTSQRMYMHFAAEWYSAPKKRWVATGSASRWIRVGSARFLSTQAGFSFQFADPPRGTRFLMRGVVHYQWRARRAKSRRWVVVRRARRVTAGGYRGVVGSTPAGRSDATCLVSH